MEMQASLKAIHHHNKNKKQYPAFYLSPFNNNKKNVFN